MPQQPSYAFSNGAIRQRFGMIWDVFLRWMRVLWACRVGATSAGLGALLFWLASPARDLFMEVRPFPLYWSVFFLMVLLWSMIVHYSARKVLEQQAWATRCRSHVRAQPDLADLVKSYRLPAAWIPRLLGLGCLGAIWEGIRKARLDLEGAQAAMSITDPAWLLWLLAATTAVYCIYVLLRRRVVDPESRGIALGHYLREWANGEGSSVLTEKDPFWFFALATRSGRRLRGTMPNGYPKKGGVTWDVVAVFLLLTLATVWTVAVVWPWLIEWLAPRALFVVLMLGLPVSLLAYLSALSHFVRVPLIALLVVALTIATGLVPQFHDQKTMESRDVRRLELADAVDRWIRLNCNLPDGAKAEPCGENPVIVASAGGASRAAFFTASVIGDIIDDGRIDLKRRLFAISGVSGGSVGAAMIRAAIDDAGPEGQPPCQSLGSSWFGDHAGSAPPYRWKDCLQALTSGDFLSRPVIGLAFRDLFGFPFGLLWMRDRAALLEDAFDDQYRSLTGKEVGLGRAIGEFPNLPGRWSPLLVLNTTSALDGRRSIVSDLRTYSCRGDEVAPLFPSAVDLLDTLSGVRACLDGKPVVDRKAPALSLAAGATASARFPIVSPYGGIRRGGA